MDRFKYFVFAPRKVYCFNCKAEGPSKLHREHQVWTALMIVFALVVTWLTGYLPGPQRPITLGSWFGPQYTPILVIVWWLIALSMVFSQKGHRCASCGSEFLKPL
jgi:hypothetical protein